MRRNEFGLALAGGGPLGAIYETGVMVALEEALVGLDLTQCGVYVGVSAGGFMAAGLANGVSARELHQLFIESEAFDDPFEPDLLLSPALGEYARRMISFDAVRGGGAALSRGSVRTRIFESFTRLARPPAGMFDNSRIGHWLAKHFSQEGRTNDFRDLRTKLFLVATDLDTAEAVAFGSEGRDHVPISRAVQASAALPGLFPPVEIDGRHYVDGALKKDAARLCRAARRGKIADLRQSDRAVRTPISPPEKRLSLIDFGLPVVLSQTFRAIIHSRMRVGMETLSPTIPEADVVLFEPSRSDADMFFTNVFSYSGRRRQSEHAYQQRAPSCCAASTNCLSFSERHGVTIDRAALEDSSPTLLGPTRRPARRPAALQRAAEDLDGALKRLEAAVEAHQAS